MGALLCKKQVTHILPDLFVTNEILKHERWMNGKIRNNGWTWSREKHCDKKVVYYLDDIRITGHADALVKVNKSSVQSRLF